MDAVAVATGAATDAAAWQRVAVRDARRGSPCDAAKGAADRPARRRCFSSREGRPETLHFGTRAGVGRICADCDTSGERALRACRPEGWGNSGHCDRPLGDSCKDWPRPPKRRDRSPSSGRTGPGPFRGSHHRLNGAVARSFVFIHTGRKTSTRRVLRQRGRPQCRSAPTPAASAPSDTEPHSQGHAVRARRPSARQTAAMATKAARVSARFSQCFARRRSRPKREKVRATAHRDGGTTKPRVPALRRTMSIERAGMAATAAFTRRAPDLASARTSSSGGPRERMRRWTRLTEAGSHRGADRAAGSRRAAGRGWRSSWPACRSCAAVRPARPAG